ncbi:MAG: fibrobacter succinogenes major paralogous domain-containing protein [Bacteroidales bacterium]|nr:fibrobacter succinogenes major paralogous domain-containing protein [Bacteroidales bacterium]
MKKLLTIFVLLLAAHLTFGQNGCNDSIPGWGESLGVVSFKTDQTWIVGNQEWSDVVMATACRKEKFDSGDWDDDGNANFNADCRFNPNYGDLFSWCAVYRFQNELCPNGWRVPTAEEFRTLNLALDGQDVELGYSFTDTIIRDKYLNGWGGDYGGYCESNGMLHWQGSSAQYWSLSQTEHYTRYAFLLHFDTSGYIHSLDAITKRYGFQLRCVRNK